METVGTRLEAILKRNGWSQRELARRAKLTPVHVGQIIRKLRKDPSASVEDVTLRKLAAGAGVTVSWLLDGRGDPWADGADPDPPTSIDRAPPKFAALPNWDELRASALALEPALPTWALDEVALSYPLATAPATPGMVVAMARIAMQLLPPPKREAKP